MKKIILGFSLVAACGALLVASDMDLGFPNFGAADGNKDGSVSSTEWQDYTRKNFTEFDSDKNGSLDQNEFASLKSGIKKRSGGLKRS